MRQRGKQNGSASSFCPPIKCDDLCGVPVLRPRLLLLTCVQIHTLHLHSRVQVMRPCNHTSPDPQLNGSIHMHSREDTMRVFFQAAVASLYFDGPRLVLYSHMDVAPLASKAYFGDAGVLDELEARCVAIATWSMPLQAPRLSATIVSIPDPYFINSFGYTSQIYESTVSSLVSRPVPWQRQRKAIVWRGSKDNDRSGVRERLVSEAARLNKILPVGLGKGQLDVAAVDAAKHNQLSFSNMLNARAILSVDGWANEWQGLFFKLLSNSVVLKVQSTLCKQWYYPGLKPWEHFVPVAADLHDLGERVKFVLDKANEKTLRKIVKASTCYMLTFSYGLEVNRLNVQLQSKLEGRIHPSKRVGIMNVTRHIHVSHWHEASKCLPLS